MKSNRIFKSLSLSVLLTSTILSSSTYGSSRNNNNNETREEFESRQAQLAPVMGARAIVQRQAMQEVQVVSQNSIESIQKFFKQQHIPTHCEDERAPARLLSLDGGGLRGLIFLPQLRALEILTGKPVCELFDRYWWHIHGWY